MLLYIVALSLLFVHELDAVHKHEWRLLYVLRSLPEKAARNLFIALHVPIFFYLIWASSVGPPAVKTGTEIILSLFMLIHSVIHWRLRNKAGYGFRGVLSQFYIYGSGIFSAFFLISEILKSSFTG